MKDRFTTAATTAEPSLPPPSSIEEVVTTSTNNLLYDVDRSPSAPPSAGLYWPKQIVVPSTSNKKADDDQDKREKKSLQDRQRWVTVGDGGIQLTRMTQQFFPTPMLCKRVGVSPTAVVRNNSSTTPSSVPVSNKTVARRQNENAYFENEILPLATAGGRRQRGQDIKITDQPAERFSPSSSDRLDDDDELSNRPPLDKLKSIFEAESDDDDESIENNNEDDSIKIPEIGNDAAREAPQTSNETNGHSKQFVLNVDDRETYTSTSNALVIHNRGNARKPVDTSSHDDQLSTDSSMSSRHPRSKKEKKRKRSKSRKKKRRKEKDGKKTKIRRQRRSRSNSRDGDSSCCDVGSSSIPETLKIDYAYSIKERSMGDRIEDETKKKRRKKKKGHRDRSREAKER
mmetsp:Transcript_26704/g.63687  ORF Transcript_26704/g.63687 Transcript_26704/m.63687 type:complete len:400 (+) Transcript_26704:2-1201(+)